ncbi:putative allantoate protein [Tothia fuscella]|uniref:Allantoate protein n=1 Tax=Tothia fuscella TaxID=1048955 RepID=A0A9P4NH10_9PEZI|nr:putative allantoate protein [Tothia fuscella]
MERNVDLEEKSAVVVTKEETISHSDDEQEGNLDAAGKFLQVHKEIDSSNIDINRVRHKIDRNVIICLCLVYIMTFLDKAIYNYAGVMGMKKDLKLKGSQFSHPPTGYAVAHLVMQIPNAYLIQRLPVSKWLGGCILAWGIVTMATAAVTNFQGMLATRVLLGMAESTVSPSLMLITAQWYTKSEQAPRFAVWHCGPGVSQILGGLLSFAFQAVPKDYPVSSWRLMFITLGAVTVLTAVIVLFYLPDTPMDAKFLTTEEKVAVLRHVSINMTGVANRTPRPKEILEALKDLQILLLIFPGVFATMSTGLTATYSTTLIKRLGFTGRQSALLNMPAGVVGIVTNLIVGFGIRKTSNRWLWGIGLTVPGIIGASLLSFLRRSNIGGTLAGLYMVSAIYSITTVVQQWAMSNVSGNTKRAVVAALMAACYGLGSIIAPQTFQARDEKGGYIPAKITILITQSVCALVFVLLFMYYKMENGRRNRIDRQAALEDDTTGARVTTEEAWSGMTDRQNKRFRYVY